jgi:hypothetical protein
VYYTWNCKSSESFSTIQDFPFLPPNNWKDINSSKWDNQWYYETDQLVHPVIPKIVNYDNKNYKLPKVSLKLLEEEFIKKQKLGTMNKQLPVAHNIHSDQTNQVAGTENITEPGASIDDVLEQERNLMEPINELKQQTYEHAHRSPFPEVRELANPELSHATIIQELQSNNVQPEFNIPKFIDENVSKLIPELELQQNENILHELTENKETSGENMIQRKLMPGMEQKQLLDERTLEKQIIPNKITPTVIKVKKNNYNLSLSILLAVLLIGFLYYTRN